MIYENILENFVAVLYRQAAMLYSKTVAPNYRWQPNAEQ